MLSIKSRVFFLRSSVQASVPLSLVTCDIDSFPFSGMRHVHFHHAHVRKVAGRNARENVCYLTVDVGECAREYVTCSAKPSGISCGVGTTPQEAQNVAIHKTLRKSASRNDYAGAPSRRSISVGDGLPRTLWTSDFSTLRHSSEHTKAVELYQGSRRLTHFPCICRSCIQYGAHRCHGSKASYSSKKNSIYS